MAIYGFNPYCQIHHTCFLGSSPFIPSHLQPSAVKFETATAQNISLRDPELSNNASPPQSRLSRKSQDFRSVDLKVFVRGEYEIGEPFYLLNRICGKSSVTVFECRQVHASLVKVGAVGADDVVGHKLVKAYLKNDESLDDARKVFDELPDRKTASYAALIGSYCRSERWTDLFSVFEKMIVDGFFPDKYLVPTIFKACSALQMVNTGKMVHGYGIRRSFCHDVVVGNALIDFYSNCGDLRYVRSVFDSMIGRDVVSWTSLVVAYFNNGLPKEGSNAFWAMQSDGLEADLISWSAFVSGLARNGEIKLALECLQKMEETGLLANVNTWNGIISGCVESKCYEYALDSFCKVLSICSTINPVTFVNVLSVCSNLKDLKLGMSVHGCAMKFEFCGNIRVASSLLNMYTKCGSIDQAEKVFKRMNQRNTAVWNEMIAAYAKEGKSSLAMQMFESLQDSGIRPDEITYNTLVGLYVKDGKKNEAYELLNEMINVGLHPTVVTFNILISGFQQCGMSHEALILFQSMQLLSTDRFSLLMKAPIEPNHVTISGALAACSDLEFLLHGKEIHAYVLRNNLESNVFVSSALVDMYSKCHDMDAAKEVFWRMQTRNTVSWNILMAACVTNRQPYEVFVLLKRMLEDEIEPSNITFMILIRACGDIAALSFGRVLHGFVIKNGFFGSKDKFICTLIDMYAKCGSLSEAETLFDSETSKDTAIWNSMISSLAAYGMARNSIALFERMESSGSVPDDITFLTLLSACARDGLSEEAWKYFDSMSTTYGLVPSLEHYTCMVSILAASGLIDQALEFIEKMPYEPDACTWVSLLKACRFHSNPEVGECAARALFELEPGNAANYILLSNIYASVGLWDSARSLRAMIETRQLSSSKEFSSIDIGGDIMIFHGGKESTPMLQDIMDTWDELASEIRHLGCTPLDPVLVSNGGRNLLSCLHTEKLAICCGIISLNGSTTIRVSKNIRMCIDCHTSAKLLTKIIGRDIFVKDAGFYHHIKEGVCSCRDKW
ncbi:hypothetical protein V2J09_000769 [Rumex salicifolius]